MNPTVSDRQQIEDLLTAYAIDLDIEDVEACIALFTTDGEFEVYGRRFSGHDGLRTMLTGAPRGMHFAGRALIGVSGESASVRSQLVFIEAALAEVRMAIYDDEVVKVDGRWRFQHRRCRFLTPDGLADRPAKKP